MLFSSYTFLFQFLPAVALAFAAARRHSPRAGILVLAAASLFFYGAWRPIYLLLLLASIAANFSLGLLMEDPLRRRTVGAGGQPEPDRHVGPRQRRRRRDHPGVDCPNRDHATSDSKSVSQ